MKQVERYFCPAVFTYEPGQEIAMDFPDLKCATSSVNDNDALLPVLSPLSGGRPTRRH